MKRSVLLLIQILFFSCTNKNKIMPNNHNKEQVNNNKQYTEWSESDWQNKLNDDEYYVLRQKGTEKPFSGILLHNKEQGYYACKGCGTLLFSSNQKFDAHCGWPSFDNELDNAKIKKIKDTSHGMIRTEIVCSNCGGHLGHLFDDGPTESGLRYCVNSLSLDFKPENKIETIDTATFGGGCFWCTEAIFLAVKGVKKVESGYAGGNTKNPTYKEVCSGNTGHAEVIQISYDSNLVNYTTLLEIFFSTHNPTTLNQQGADIGTQYRSIIFYHNENQQHIANEIIQKLEKEHIYPAPIVTQVSKISTFYKAESYHQNYFNQNKEQAYCKAVIVPKLEKFKKIFKDKISE